MTNTLASWRITPRGAGLTETQLRVSRYIDAYRIAHHGVSPTLSEIASACWLTQRQADEAISRLRAMNAVKGY